MTGRERGWIKQLFAGKMFVYHTCRWIKSDVTSSITKPFMIAPYTCKHSKTYLNQRVRSWFPLLQLKSSGNSPEELSSHILKFAIPNGGACPTWTRRTAPAILTINLLDRVPPPPPPPPRSNTNKWAQQKSAALVYLPFNTKWIPILRYTGRRPLVQ